MRAGPKRHSCVNSGSWGRPPWQSNWGQGKELTGPTHQAIVSTSTGQRPSTISRTQVWGEGRGCTRGAGKEPARAPTPSAPGPSDCKLHLFQEFRLLGIPMATS